MKEVILFIILFSISSNATAQSGWISLNSNTTNTITDLCFIDNNTGFAVTKATSSPFQNTIIKTTNGGLNWNIVFNQNSAGLRKMLLYNTIGYLQDTSGYLKTSNSGNNWIHYNLPTGVKALYFIDSMLGYCSADSVKTYKTTDGGINWIQIPSNSSTIFQIQTMYFINSSTGFLVGLGDTHEVGFYSTTLRTTNGGLNWLFASSSVGNQGSRAVFGRNFNSDTLFCFFPAYNLKSSNGGLYWNTFTAGTYPGVYSFFSNAMSTDWFTSTGIGSSTPQLFKSTNSGVNWIANPYFPAVPLYAVTFPSELTGYIGGSFGAIYKTINGGVVTGFTQTSTSIPEKFSLSQNYPNPFNPNTVIKWEVPVSGYVSLKVFNAIGNEVKTLVNENQNAGSYSVSLDGSKLPSGIYFYKITAGNFSETKRMVLIK